MIPIFKNTEEALAYGHTIKEKPELIKLLIDEREKLSAEFTKLMDTCRYADALYLASGQCQFVREAIEETIK